MLPASVRIFICTLPQDMRKSFDALAVVTRELLGQDPQAGALYIFVGKRPTRIKVLWWEKNGYCILYKRLHRALFRLPPSAGEAGAAHQIDAVAFAELIAGVECEKNRTKRLTAPLH